MKRTFKPTKTCIINKPKTEGKSLEEQIQAITGTDEPIEAGAPMIYTECKDGVRPETDIRTDRFEIALEACDNYARSVIAKSAELNKDVTLNTENENNKTQEQKTE